jgi:proline dehydrogenase
MLRNVFIRLSMVPQAQPVLSRLPVANSVARRFVAGETIDEAVSVARGLNEAGLNLSLDFLGESVTTMAEAATAADTYLRLLDRIGTEGVRANVSIKLTGFGLDLDAVGCRRLVRQVAARARDAGTFLRIDMEGTPHTDRTLALVRELHAEALPVGTVLQAYLYRTEEDLIALAEAGIKIRLCKGAYQEPADKAFPAKTDVDANYVRLTHILLDYARAADPADPAGRTPPLAALATHDERMIHAGRDYAARRSIPHDRFEFQMLYGVRRDLQELLARDGYAVRTYVPFGTHWYPYFMRRLAERPANVWFIASNLFRP